MDLIAPKRHLQALERIPHAEESREGFLLLDRNERTEDFPTQVLRELQDRVTSFCLRAYPEPAPLYRELARWLGIPRDQLLLTGGADGGLRTVFDTFVEPGEEVVHVVPSYGMNPVYCAIAAAVERPVRFGEDLTLPLERILEQITPRSKMVLLANPNQPVERFYPGAELEKLLQVCAANGALLVLDEAYHPFCPETALPLVSNHANLIVVRSFSKAFGLAGLRLGYLVSQPQNIHHLNKVRPMYETHAFAISAARYLIANDGILHDYVARVHKARERLKQGLRAFGLTPHGQWGNAILVALPPTRPAAEVAGALRDRGILVRAETAPPLSHHLRITLGSPEQVDRLLKAWAEVEETLVSPASHHER